MAPKKKRRVDQADFASLPQEENIASSNPRRSSKKSNSRKWEIYGIDTDELLAPFAPEEFSLPRRPSAQKPARHQCHKCGGNMQYGVVADDQGGGQANNRYWVSGEAAKALLEHKDLQLGADKVPISAFRCDRCGYLELYARDEFEPQ